MHRGYGLRQELESVRDALVSAGDDDLAGLVSEALAGGDHSVRDFLVSDELWGGSGSVADQAGLATSRDASRRAIEAALVRLGAAQIRAGVVNVRTAMWVDAFRSRQRDGI
jgi:hypothetical protein